MSTPAQSSLRSLSDPWLPSPSSTPIAIAPLRAAKAAHCRTMMAWHGRSGRRYIVSIYDPAAVPDYGVPDCGDAVLIAVARTRHGRRILGIGTGSAAALAAMPRCREIHVHLLARGTDSKARLLADLLNREDALLPAA